MSHLGPRLVAAPTRGHSSSWRPLRRNSRAPQVLIARHLNPCSSVMIWGKILSGAFQSAFYSRSKKNPAHTHLGETSQTVHAVPSPHTMRSLATSAARSLMFGRSFFLLRKPSARNVTTRATSYTLNTGAKIPALGFGTFQDPDSQEETVSRALQKGMRLIDTARVYNVEEQVGRGIKKSGVPREDIFVSTKLWCNDYHPYDVGKALDDSLRDLDTPYVDLLLMHYPCTFKRGPDRFPRDAEGRMILGETTYVDTWKAMERLTKSKVKAIGVSNFSKGEIETLLQETSTVGTSKRCETRN